MATSIFNGRWPRSFLITLLCFTVLPLLGQTETVIFRFSGSADITTVHVAGSFNNWQSDEYALLKQAGGTWQTELSLAEGIYTYRFIINGERWLKDPTNPSYGGPRSNSNLIVSRTPIPQLAEIEPAGGGVIPINEATRAQITLSNIDHLDWEKSRLLRRFYPVSTEITYGDARSEELLSLQPDPQGHVALDLPSISGDVEYTLLLHTDRGWDLPPVAWLWSLVDTINSSPEVHLPFRVLNAGSNANYAAEVEGSARQLVNYTWAWQVTPAGLAIHNAGQWLQQGRIVAQKQGQYRLELTQEGSALAQTQIVVLDAGQLQWQAQIASAALPARQVKTVHVVGDFNRWQIDSNWQLALHDDNSWRGRFSLDPGLYEYKIVIDSEIWRTDPHNSDSLADGWQGFNSLLRHRYDLLDKRRPYTSAQLAALWSNANSTWYGENDGAEIKSEWRRKKSPLAGEMYHLVRPGELPQWRTAISTAAGFYDLEQVPAWADTAVIYEIFIRTFSATGDYAGVVEKLPYLQNLGVNTIWFMPVYEGPTEHGYAPMDFFRSEADYGDLRAFRQVVDTLKQAGMRVIFDFVANHTSDQHRFFGAAQNPSSQYRDWYLWHSDGSYEYNADWDVLPDLNWRNPAVSNFMLDVADFWLATGVDGFRCDAAWGVPHSFWRRLRLHLKQQNSEFLLIDEVLPRDPEFRKRQFDASYDTDFYGNLLDVLYKKKPVRALAVSQEKSRVNYAPQTLDLRYIENHDMPRMLATFGEDAAALAGVLLMLNSGMPLIYYGQETGLSEMRGAMNWQEANTHPFIAFYQQLIRLRRQFNLRATSKDLNYEALDDRLLKFGNTNFTAWLNFSDQEERSFVPTTGRIVLRQNDRKTSEKSIQLAPFGFVVMAH
jgi:glycosidase